MTMERTIEGGTGTRPPTTSRQTLSLLYVEKTLHDLDTGTRPVPQTNAYVTQLLNCTEVISPVHIPNEQYLT